MSLSDRIREMTKRVDLRGKRRAEVEMQGELSRIGEYLASTNPAGVRFDEEAMRSTREALLGRYEELSGDAGTVEKVGTVSTRSIGSWNPARISLAVGVVTMVAFALILALWLPGRGPAPLAKVIVERGKVSIETSDGGSRVLDRGGELHEGERVRTWVGSWARVELAGGSSATLAGGTTAGVALSERGGVRLLHAEGKSFHQVEGGADYQVLCREIVVTGDDTFLVEGGEEGLRVLALLGELDLDGYGESEPGGATIEEGEEALLSWAAGAPAVDVEGIRVGQLDDEWYEWVLTMDPRLAKYSEALEEIALAPEPAPEKETPPVPRKRRTPNVAPVPRQPQPPTPEEMGSPEQETGVPPEEPRDSIFLFVSEQGLPPEEPEEPPDEPEVPDGRPDVPVTAPGPEQEPETTEYGVLVSWLVKGEEQGYDGVAVLRSAGGVQPQYPQHWIATVAFSEGNRYLDTAVQEGFSYSYRLALIRVGTPVIYSEVMVIDL